MKEAKFNVFTKFVPTTDVDGVDIKPEYLSYISNMKIKNGFIESLPNFAEQTLPASVTTLLSSGYSIEAVTYFYHSKQGHNVVYVLWKESALENDRIKILVNGEVMTNPKYAKGELQYLTPPENINFHLVNDELKINLNCEGRIGDAGIGGRFIVNLNLAWLEEIRYEVSGSPTRSAGWYLSLRWLGKEYAHGLEVSQGGFYNSTGNYEEVIKEEFEGSLIPEISVDGNIFIFNGTAYITNTSGTESKTGIIEWRDLNNVGKVKIAYRFAGTPISSGNFEIRINLLNGITREFIKQVVKVYSTSEKSEEVEIPLDKFTTDKFILQFVLIAPPIYGGSLVSTQVYLNYIYLYPSPVFLVAKYFNGQRALLLGDKKADTEYLRIPHTFDFPSGLALILYIHKDLDYRISEYELYCKSFADELFYKKIVYGISGNWSLSGNYYVFDSSQIEIIEEPEETLNFNYGFGEVFVDNDFKILSEAVLTGRVYAATGSYLIRMSHLSGSGKIQPDSFPYDFDKKVGYIENLRSSSVSAVILLNENNLALISEDGFTVFNSFASRGVSIKQLKMETKLFAGFNSKSLTKSISGNSTTAGMYFITKEGMWQHDGSYNSLPVNVTFQELFNYWRQSKKDGIGFFVKETGEYWYEYDNVNFLVYEVAYKAFRIHSKPAVSLKGSFEFPDGSAGIYTSSKVYKWSLSNVNYGVAGISSHKSYLNSGDFPNKILQSIMVELKKEFYETVPTFNYFVQVLADNKVYQFIFSSNEKKAIRLFPLSVRCKEVTVIALFPVLSHQIAISQITLYYTVDGLTRDINASNEHLTISLPGGYGKDYGRSYIVI